MRGMRPLLDSRYSMLATSSRGGFTLFEIIITVALVAILSAAAVMIINPPQLYAKARNAERVSHVNAILNAIGEHMADNRGSFICASGSLPTSTKRMASTLSTSTYDIAPCLVPAYLASMPYDPSLPGARYASTSQYDSGYTLFRNASSGRITVAAPGAELGVIISILR